MIRFLRACAPSVLLLSLCTVVHAQPIAPKKTQRVVLIVWDGLRPDSVSQTNTPVLFQLAQSGVTFARHHPVYPSSTEVNGTALATGMMPEHGGIIGNKEYRPDIDPLKAVAMEDLAAVRRGDELGAFLNSATVAEIVQSAGERTAVAGTKAVTILADRSATRTSPAARRSTDIYEGHTVPDDALGAIVRERGAFPPDITFPNTDQDAWTTAALTKDLWKDGVPAYSLLWLSDVDYSQHETAPGAPTAVAALKSCDDQLAKVLAALDAKGLRDSTAVMVVSDHGFSTISRAVDIETELGDAGFVAKSKFKAPPKTGEIVVVGLGGSVFFYVGGHDENTTRRLVEFLQTRDYCGALMTRSPAAGTLSLAQVGINSAAAPDVAMSFRWDGAANEFGVPGTINADFKRKVGQGSHASLSRFDMHNTLIASGPDFKVGAVDQTPSGNVDLAPTILFLLGLTPPRPMDGRVLREALRETLVGAGEKGAPVESGEWTAQNTVNGQLYRQNLRWSKVGDTVYLDEGNRQPVAP